jgi:hypothetical protein
LSNGNCDIAIANINEIHKIENDGKTKYVIIQPIFQYKHFAVIVKKSKKFIKINDMSTGGLKGWDLLHKTLKQLKKSYILASKTTDHQTMLEDLNNFLADDVIKIKNIEGNGSPIELLHRFFTEGRFDAFVGGITERLICQSHLEVEELLTFNDINSTLIDLTQKNAFVTTLQKYYENFEFRKNISEFVNGWKIFSQEFNKNQEQYYSDILENHVTYLKSNSCMSENLTKDQIESIFRNRWVSII